ncbi:hypothetical protein N7468_007427 [Penicillium chermesinum]|uniref:ABC transporter domain-containing protein n=1 Tax=Penicillium chermesinum TaxID=63820 RepID=A0A9W9TKH9_9EURO|nr:uncharacterized protein N7468_007427 [Penicillium chermesinum]KAJ5226202.1 hypothetical protein N7468_007427 [Penicillium chermesinum]
MFVRTTLRLPSHGSPENPKELQHWAVVGTSGRTDLLDVLRGQHICIPPSARSYPYLLSDEIAAKDPRLRYVGAAIQYIGFSGEGSGAIGGIRGAYLSARYESLREETDWTVEQFLRGQTSLNPIEGEENGTVRDEAFLKEVITDLRLSDLLDMPVANLSNGQTRRARIAKALLQKPELLLLDEPFMGLDPATVRSISNLLHRLAEKQAPRLILALRPQDTVPDWITHTIVVGNNHRIALQGPKEVTENTLNLWKQVTIEDSKELKGKAKAKVVAEVNSLVESGVIDNKLIEDLTSTGAKRSTMDHEVQQGGEPVIEMEGVRVQYGDKVVLGNWTQNIRGEAKEGLHWRVRRGQRWAILGANGSGKTTLLSLITSDHPQTYALPVRLLGRSRLPEAGKPGISIFELQSRLGHSSPEIHAFFPRQLTIRESLDAALTFFKPELDPTAQNSEEQGPPVISTDMFPKPNRQTRRPRRNPPPFVPEDYYVEYADKITFGQLSTAQQRIVLFLRALIHKPDIVILDEPFSGLTASQREKCLHFLEHGDAPYPMIRRRSTTVPTERIRGLSDEQALIMISHVKEEIPDTVRHFMRLPSNTADGEDAIDFRSGFLKRRSNFRDPEVWGHAWSPASEFNEISRRAKHPTRAAENPRLVEDMEEFEWYSI